MVNRGPFLEFIRNRVQESAINTYTEEEIRTPCSKSENLAMLIHMVKWQANDLDSVDGAIGTKYMGLYKKSQSSAVGISDTDTVQAWQHSQQLGVEQGTLSEFQQKNEAPKVMYFDPPILYASASIYHGVQCVNSDNTKGVSDVEIGYTLEKVSKDAFIDALVD